MINTDSALERVGAYIGKTPLLRLRRVRASERFLIYAKAEFLNLGGSIKSRTAFWILREAERSGKLRQGMTIIEASTGNQGIALAMLAAAGGFFATIVMPSFVPLERKQIIESYGARVILVESHPTIRQTVMACIDVAEKLAQQPGTFYARQFENPSNPIVHEQTTGPEILDQVPERIGAFVAAVGTGGTLMGVARALRRADPSIRIVAVEPRAAAVLSGGENSMHEQYGIGEGFVPLIFDRELVDEVIPIDDAEAYGMAREIALTEGLGVGVSSGTNVAAALKVARSLSGDKAVVTVLNDSAERYLTVFAAAC